MLTMLDFNTFILKLINRLHLIWFKYKVLHIQKVKVKVKWQYPEISKSDICLDSFFSFYIYCVKRKQDHYV